MKTIKVSEATGPTLEWLVAKCEGVRVEITSVSDVVARRLLNLTAEEEAQLPRPTAYCTIPGVGQAQFSTNWAQGGPLIDSASITIIRCDDDYATDKHGFTTSKRIPVWGAVIGQNNTISIYGSQGDRWGNAYSFDEEFITYGPTPLIAAMRCYVASKLGDTAEVPDELIVE